MIGAFLQNIQNFLEVNLEGFVIEGKELLDLSEGERGHHFGILGLACLNILETKLNFIE